MWVKLTEDIVDQLAQLLLVAYENMVMLLWRRCALVSVGRENKVKENKYVAPPQWRTKFEPHYIRHDERTSVAFHLQNFSTYSSVSPLGCWLFEEIRSPVSQANQGGRVESLTDSRRQNAHNLNT